MASEWLRISLFIGVSTSLCVGKWLQPQTIPFVVLACGHVCAHAHAPCVQPSARTPRDSARRENYLRE